MKLKAYLVTDKDNEPVWVNGFTYIYLKPPEINQDVQNLHRVTIRGNPTFIKRIWGRITGE